MTEIKNEEYGILIERDVKLSMIRDAMRKYMEIWRVDSEPTLGREFMTVLRAVFPYDYEETLARLRNKKKEEEEK